MHHCGHVIGDFNSVFYKYRVYIFEKGFSFASDNIDWILNMTDFNYFCMIMKPFYQKWCLFWIHNTAALVFAFLQINFVTEHVWMIVFKKKKFSSKLAFSTAVM